MEKGKSLWNFFLVLAPVLATGESESSSFVMRQNEAYTLTLQAYKVSTVTVPNIPFSISSVMIQFHSQIHNISLSSEKTFSYQTTKVGTNVGLLSLPKKGQSEIVWYLTFTGPSNKSSTVANVTVVGHVFFYSDLDPVPGGCNQVFNVEIDPSIELSQENHRTQVFFQWANLHPDISDRNKAPDCESKEVTKMLEYAVYVYFLDQRDLSESHFITGIKKMLSPADIVSNGRKVLSLSDSPTSKSQTYVTSETDQGAMYAVVVKSSHNNHVASYITAVSYACDFQKGNCSSEISAVEIVLAILLGSVGLFICFLGHRFFKSSQFIFGFMFLALLCYILISIPHTTSLSVRLAIAACVGVLGGFLWVAFWFFCVFPMASVFLTGLCAGYLVAASFFFTPFGNMDWWTTQTNYGVAFPCIILLFSVCLMSYSKFLHILSCSLVGSYMALMSLAVPLRSSLRLIFLNALYHQTEEDYLKVKVITPFHLQDIILATAWPVLLLVGIMFQHYRERGRPPFEQPVINCWKKQDMDQHKHIVEEDDEIMNDILENSCSEANERRPLLSSVNASSYNTVNNMNQQHVQRNRNLHLAM